MPARIMLSCSIFLLAVASLAQPAKSLGMKSVATVSLPCESTFQMISPKGDQVALRCKDHTVRLVNVSSGMTARTFGAEPRIAGFNYSQALGSSGLTWTPANLDRFLAGPAKLVPGTAMQVALPDAAKRADLIAYLATLAPAR